MISVVIPIYNQDVTRLVSQLHNQLSDAGVIFEILAIEDGSHASKAALNDALKEKTGVRYIVHSINKGRSAIRNELAKTAKFDTLIYLDCDSELIHGDYIRQYLKLKEKEVVYGGTSYAGESRGDDYYLHEQFGKQREALPSAERMKKTWLSFKTNNFMARRDIVLRFPFDETITGYGYEDLVFANQFKNAGIPILHIDNEVLHSGLEKNEVFLEKTAKSIENLVVLHASGKIKSTPLIKAYGKLRFVLQILEAGGLLLKAEMQLKLILKEKKPPLRIFDLWKLLVYHIKQKSLPEIR